MNKRIFLNIFVMCCVYSIGDTKQYTDDYCWRDYHGTMPQDALPTNIHNENQKPLYIGHTIYENKLIPGKLYDGDNKIYYEFYNVEYSTTDNVKVLCSQNPNKFEWIPTRHVDVHNLINKTLITGGFEPKCSTYLGRVITGEGLTPGKVICCEAAEHCFGLYTTSNGTGTLHFDFEILTYNENPATPINIDLRGPFPKRSSGKCKRININLYN